MAGRTTQRVPDHENPQPGYLPPTEGGWKISLDTHAVGYLQRSHPWSAPTQGYENLRQDISTPPQVGWRYPPPAQRGYFQGRRP